MLTQRNLNTLWLLLLLHVSGRAFKFNLFSESSEAYTVSFKKVFTVLQVILENVVMLII